MLPTFSSVVVVLLIVASSLTAVTAAVLAVCWRRRALAAEAHAEGRVADLRASADRLELLAAVDGLTGVLNHRGFHQRLEEEIARAVRHRRPLSLVVLDLDHFKQINDMHGHPAGDRVLAETAARLVALARVGEHVARVGGEEFALILPDANGVGAFAAAERMRNGIAARPFADVGAVTISAGVCEMQVAGSAGELYRLADTALYWAKAHGRNLTFRYTPQVALELDHNEGPAMAERARAIASLRALATLVDRRHPSTERHTERVAALAHALALEAGWSPDRAQRLRDAALVHDVGKVALREDVLMKAQPLDAEELAHLQTHAAIGARIAGTVLDEEQVAWIRAHHERWDGGGYPAGLRGSAIPDGARLLTVADAWDAMTSDRWYQAPLDADAALDEVLAQAGRHFAPDATRLLEGLAASGRLRRIAGAH